MFCKQNNIFMLKDNCKNKVECLFCSENLLKSHHDKITKFLGAAKTSILPVNFLEHFTSKSLTISREFYFCIYYSGIKLLYSYVHIKSNINKLLNSI